MLGLCHSRSSGCDTVVIIFHPQKYQTKHNSNFEALCLSYRSFIRKFKRNSFHLPEDHTPDKVSKRESLELLK